MNLRDGPSERSSDLSRRYLQTETGIKTLWTLIFTLGDCKRYSCQAGPFIRVTIRHLAALFAGSGSIPRGYPRLKYYAALTDRGLNQIKRVLLNIFSFLHSKLRG